MMITNARQKHGYVAARIRAENNIVTKSGDIAEPYFNTWLVMMKWNAAL